ncbi:unnamed protein product [Amoebophrya sp. A120]|nr:unnamed protein product [Amoebophrya sp. A120]|eukprot:GSA120T00009950001.1
MLTISEHEEHRGGGAATPGSAGHNMQHQSAPDAPNLPLASPLTRTDVANPVQFSANSVQQTPKLQTPAITAHQSMAYPGRGGSIDFGALGGSSTLPGINPEEEGVPLQSHLQMNPINQNKTPFSDIFGWSWECGSDVGSVPSIWSRASTQRSGSVGGGQFGGGPPGGAPQPGTPSAASLGSMNAGGGLLNKSISSSDGQRLLYIKPQEVPTATGGTVVIGLRKEIPEQWWNQVEILLVGGSSGTQLTLKPSGIKKGKKLCIKVPPALECRDYDVRVVFAGKILHGAIPLAVRGDSDAESDSET